MEKCIHKDINNQCCLYRPLPCVKEGKVCKDYRNKFSWEKNV